MRLGVWFFSLLLLPVGVGAATFQAGETVKVQSSENAYAAGSIVQVSSEAPKDVFLLGETVQIQAPVGEDAWLLGQTVMISEPIGEDLHALAAMIGLQDRVEGDVLLLGQKIIVTEEGKVGGTAILFGQEITAEGTFEGNVKFFAAGLRLGGRYHGDVVVNVGQSFEILSGTTIEGDLTLSLPEGVSVTIPEGTIAGEIHRNITEQGKRGELLRGLTLLTLLSHLLLGSLLIIFAKNFAVRYGENVRSAPWKTLGMGALAFAAPPVIALLLLFPILTIPLALLTLLSWGSLLYMASLLAGLLLANLLFPIDEEETLPLVLLKFAFGTTLLSLIRVIPFFGFLLRTAVLLLSIGALLQYYWRSWKALQRAHMA
jgi:cytoskeletal protein CcmA (bactofilin family)